MQKPSNTPQASRIAHQLAIGTIMKINHVGKTALMSLSLTAALLLVSSSAYSLEKEPHSFLKSECANCHPVDPSGVVSEQTTVPLTQVCKKCHEEVFSRELTHPFSVRPRLAKIPKDLPLSPSGEITCATCHKMHGSRLTASGTKSNYLRQTDPGKPFCKICHNGGRPTDSHQAAFKLAHFKGQNIVIVSSEKIDPISKNCLSCHDGSFSISIAVSETGQNGCSFVGINNRPHPIGVNYEEARSRPGSNAELRPLAAIDRRLRLFNGSVGCGTCHNPYSAVEEKLVMSDSRSGLCCSCHSMAG